jgi:putative ABC transport system substrate-binding protein
MRRRDFIRALGSIAATWPLQAAAQSSIKPVIGYLHPFGGPLQRDLARFRKGLNTAGYSEPDNVVVEFRNAHGHANRLVELATELSRQRASVIFTSGGVAPVRAAQAVTSTVPIVFVHGSDPVRAGLVQSLARPGGNVTGVTFVTGEIQAKAFELLREALPGVINVAALVNPRSATDEARQGEVVRAARAFGMELHIVNAAAPDEFGAAFASIKQRGSQAAFVVADPVFRNRMESIVAHADRFSIPLMGFGRDFAEAGALMSYGADPSISFQEAGIYVGRILKGEKPSELPVLQPTKFELLINLKTAKARGIEISPRLIALADGVIE